jgi:hypothetical protein
MGARLASYVRRNDLALLALVVAVIGIPTAWALGRNTVGPRQLKAGAVRTKKIADDAVTSPKVADHSLLGKDFAAGELPAGERGPQGEPGPPGQTGQPGPTASSFMDFNPNPNLSLSGTNTVYVDTGDASCVLVPGCHVGPDVVMPSAGRLQVSAMIDITGTVASTGFCEARYGASPGGTILTDVPFSGTQSFWSLPGSAADADREIPLVASVDVPAGSWDVTIACKLESGNGALASVAANVLGIAG